MLKDLWSGKLSEAVAERQRAFARALSSDGAPVDLQKGDKDVERSTLGDQASEEVTDLGVMEVERLGTRYHSVA